MDSATVEVFEDNKNVLRRMAEQGINLGRTVADYPSLYKNFIKPTVTILIAREGLKSAALFISKQVGEIFDEAFAKKDFAWFMPQMIVQTFKDAAQRFAAQGLPATQAASLAADTVRAFHGLIGNAEGPGPQDALSSVFYAPRFRESIVNTLIKYMKAGTSEIKNTASTDRQLLAGMAIAYGIYVALNKKLSEHYISDDPSGHQFDLQVPSGDGNFVYIPSCLHSLQSREMLSVAHFRLRKEISRA